MRGGRRTGSGRKKGSLEKRTRAIAEKAAASGVAPLEVLLTTMRDAWEAGDRGLACEMAQAAAPYIHPRLAATEMKVEDNRNRVISDKPLTAEEWIARHGARETEVAED